MKRTKLLMFINGVRSFDISFYARTIGFNKKQVYRHIDKYGVFTFSKEGVKVFITLPDNKETI